MIQGDFTEADQIIVSLTLSANDGSEYQVEAVLDTGFSGSLVLPHRVISDLSLAQVDITDAILGDGRTVQMAVFEVTLNWHGAERTVLAYASDGDALLGMALLRGSVGTVEFFQGGLTVLDEAD